MKNFISDLPTLIFSRYETGTTDIFLFKPYGWGEGGGQRENGWVNKILWVEMGGLNKNSRGG